MQRVSAFVLVFVCSSAPPKKKKKKVKSPSHLLVSRVRRRKRPGGVTRPFFTWLQHITSFPPVLTPPLSPVASPLRPPDLTHREKLPATASVLPLQLFICPLSLSLSPPSIRSGPTADGWPPSNRKKRGLHEGVRSAFLELLRGTATTRRWRKDELRPDWQRF